MSRKLLLGADTSVKRRLAIIGSTPANMICADCLSSIQPTKQWAVPPYGVFVCRDCAKLHRFLKFETGAKPVTDDSWSKEEVDRMEEAGNENGKQLLEGKLNEDFRRPTDKAGKISFMTKKYCQFYYMSDDIKMNCFEIDSFNLHLEENAEIHRQRNTAAPARRAVSQENTRKNGVSRNDHPKAKEGNNSNLLVDLGEAKSQGGSSSAADEWKHGPFLPGTGNSLNKNLNSSPSGDTKLVRSVSDWAVFPSPQQADIDWPRYYIDRARKQNRDTLGLDDEGYSCVTPRDIDIAFI